MKFTAIFLALMSFSAFASFNEVECEGKSGDKEIYFEVEQPFPSNSVFKRATLTITENGSDSESRYTVTSRDTRGFNTIRYTGAGVTLEVNHWPDNAPRWGRNYRSTLRIDKVENYSTLNVECSFPNAF